MKSTILLFALLFSCSTNKSNHGDSNASGNSEVANLTQKVGLNLDSGIPYTALGNDNVVRLRTDAVNWKCDDSFGRCYYIGHENSGFAINVDQATCSKIQSCVLSTTYSQQCLGNAMTPDAKNPMCQTLAQKDGKGSSSQSDPGALTTAGASILPEPNAYFTFNPDLVKASSAEQAAAANIFTIGTKFIEMLLRNNIVSAWPESQIILSLSDKNSNEAVYLPASQSTLATIRLGNGDGVRLHNLWNDSDTIQYLVFFHLTQQSVKNTEGDSLRILVGLADSSVLLLKHNSCMAPSAYVVGSSLFGSDSCLRNGDNLWTTTTCSRDHQEDGCGNPLKESQLISGLLWSIARALGPDGYNQTLRLMVRAIKDLPSSPEYQDFLESLIHSDQDLNKSRFAPILIREMCKRGFDKALSSDGSGSMMSKISVSYTCPEK